VTDPPPCYWSEFAIRQDHVAAPDQPVWTVSRDATAAWPNYDGVQPLVAFDKHGLADNFERLKLPGTIPLSHKWDWLFSVERGSMKLGEAPPPLLRLSQANGVLTIESDVKILTWADTNFLARWWVNGSPVLPPRSRGMRMISLGRAVRYGKRMQIAMALPEMLGELEADDRVGLQVLYVPGGITQLPHDRIPSEMGHALSTAGPAACMPLLSNRLDTVLASLR
jgi:hypothetical protein